MAGTRGPQRVRQQTVSYQCGSEDSSNCVCLDRKFIATQELFPVEEVERLANSVLAASNETTALNVVIYPNKLTFQVSNQGTQFPEIFYEDIIQFEAVPNITDTYFLLSGRKSSVGMYLFLWFSDPSIATKIRNLISTVNPNVRLMSGPTWRGAVDSTPLKIGMTTGSQRRFSSPVTVSTTQVSHREASGGQKKKDKIPQQSMLVEWTGRPRNRSQNGQRMKQQNYEQNARSAPYNEMPKQKGSSWRRSRGRRSTSISDSSGSSRSISPNGFNQGSIFYLIKKRPRKRSGLSQSPYRHRSPSKNRRRPVVSPLLQVPMWEQRDPTSEGTPTFNHPRQHRASNQIPQHHHYPTPVNTLYTDSFRNERQPKVKFNLYPNRPIHYTPPESSTEWPDDESAYAESEEFYDDEDVNLVSAPRIMGRVRVGQLSSEPLSSHIHRPPTPPPPPPPPPQAAAFAKSARMRYDNLPSDNVYLFARHLRDDESVRSDDSRFYDSLYSEDASSTPYPTHGAACINDLSHRLQQNRLY
uniref:DUF5733 domain-containing protein n=1 Tax=Schistocephalus solidus TaxID=70667 RepID=A0A0X3PKF9_SCHSO